MDDMLKLNLSTKLMRGMVAKIISKQIFKKSGHEVAVKINELSFEMVDDKVRVHTSVDAELSKEEFTKIIKRLI